MTEREQERCRFKIEHRKMTTHVEPKNLEPPINNQRHFPQPWNLGGIHTIFNEPIYRIMVEIKNEPFFSWAAPLGGDPSRRDPNKYCTYHREKRHMTEKCFSLKQHLDQLVKEGHLRCYLCDGQKQHLTGEPRAVHNTKPHARVIEMIDTSRLSSQSHDRLRSELRKAQHLREVFHVVEGLVVSKKPRKDLLASEQHIFFSAEDLRDVQTLHDDPLVIKLRIGDLDVKRVLVDQGSCSEIMYLDLFHGLGLKQFDLQPYDTPLVGFSGKSIRPREKIILTIHSGPISLETKFLVVDIPLPYTAIMS
jgi:hypothetical protein